MGLGAGDQPAGASRQAPRTGEPTLDLTRLDLGSFHDPASVTRALFDAMVEPVVVLDVHGSQAVVAAANRAFTARLHTREHEVIGRAVEEVLPGDGGGMGRQQVLDVAALGRPRSFDGLMPAPGGQAPARFTLVPVRTAAGHTEVLAFMRDLTDTPRAQEAVDALAEKEEQLQSVVDATPVIVFTIDRTGTFTFVEGHGLEALGLVPEDAVGAKIKDFARHQPAALFNFRRALAGEFVADTLQWGERTFEVWYRPTGVGDADDGNGDGPRTPTGVLGVALDVTDRRRAEEALRATRESAGQLAAILEATTDFVGICSTEGHFTYLNRAARDAIGLSSTIEARRVHFLDIYPPWARQKFLTEVLPALDRDGHWQGELALQGKEREIHISLAVQMHPGPESAPASFSSIGRDISEQKALQEQLSHRALHDPLTELPNRVLFTDRLTQALARSARMGTNVVVLVLDVDRFKIVNDSLGHAAGDRLLSALSRRLQRVLRPADTLARLGGDEFGVLCENVLGEPAAIAERIEGALETPFGVEDGEVFLTVSIGVAMTVEGAHTDADILLRDAEAAMSRAKQRGRARHEVFDEGMRARARERVSTETELRRAIERGDLILHYQPVVSLGDGAIVGVEALVRWEHPKRGMVQPDEFIPLAEEAGLIIPLGNWVLREACRQIASWRGTADGDGLDVWVNLSARQLNHLSLLETVEEVLDEHDFGPGDLGLEITETALLEDGDSAVNVFRALERLGVCVAIDDFGTGYSSLSYLKRFPVNTLKVDRSFVDGLGRDPEDSAIVTAQVSMAHALGIEVVAEGVETERQLDQLRALGCERAQGFLFAPPLPAEPLAELLSLHPRW